MTKILVADDDRKKRYLLSDILSDAGYDVIEADNGGTAFERACNELPDLIMLDISMPVMDGFGFVQKLKTIPATRTTPIIMLTAMPAVEGELASWKLGVKHYITKPFSAERVVLTVRVALREADDEIRSRDSESGFLPPFEGTQKGISTGSPHLDNILGGGLLPNTLTLIEGTSSSGKSVLCQHITYQALQAGNDVVYLTSDDTADSLVTQMNSLGMKVLGYVQSDMVRFLSVSTPLDDNCDIAIEHGRPIDALSWQIRSLPNQWNVIIVDNITELASESEDRAVLSFFTTCKRLSKEGRTIVLVAHTYAFDDKLSSRLGDVYDAHITLRFEKFAGKSVTTAEVTKVNSAELGTPASISFMVEPGIGMRSLPFGKIKA